MALIKNSSVPIMSCQNDMLHRQYETKSFDSDSIFFLAHAALTVAHSAFNFIFNHIGAIILSVILIITIYILYISFWSPILYVKELTEIGYEHITGPDRDKRIARAQAARRLGTKIPPPYPNGWFAVAESRDLKIGDVKAVDALGLNLCVYRGEDGTAHCIDAYCPHLGANLAVGGTVCGSCIECPFHKWRFDASGACVAVPGNETVPKGISIATYDTCEADGAVWFWHDAERREPLWSLSDAPEIARYGYRGRNEFIVNAHIQEIPENGADVGHLNAVHSPSLFSAGDKFRFLHNIIGHHVWSGTWTRNEDHTATMTLSHHYDVMKCNILHTDVKITQIGPGHVRFLMQTSVGPFLFSQSVTPLAPLLQKVVHRLYTPVRSAVFAWPLIYSESKMIERDIKIWNSKCFVHNPAYLKGDKWIRAFRNWYSQFYSENSKTFNNCIQNPLDW